MIKKIHRGIKASSIETISAFARMILQSRKTLGLTQKSASEKIGIDYRHFQDIEKGKVDIRMSSLIEIQEQLGIRIEQLFCKKYGHSTCPAQENPITPDTLFSRLNQLAESGKCGLLIIEGNEVVFANRFFLDELKYKNLVALKEIPLSKLSTPALHSLKNSAEMVYAISFSTGEGTHKTFVSILKRQQESLHVICVSPDTVEEKLQEAIVLMPLFNLVKALKLLVLMVPILLASYFWDY